MGKRTVSAVMAREILDSRGNPTVSVTVATEGGFKATAMVPSGASTGKYEASERRDGDKSRYGGKGVLGAVSAVNGEIARAICGLEADRTEALDSLLCSLDGTENKSRLGANAILGTSMALARVAAMTEGVPLWQFLSIGEEKRLPVPMMNILNGGAHAGNGLDVQEFMIVPVGADSFAEGLRMGAEVYHTLKRVLSERSFATGVGDEGGFAPDLSTPEEALSLIEDAIMRAGFSKESVRISLDIAASEWYENGNYLLPKTGKLYTTEQLTAQIGEWISRYDLLSVEDPLGEDDLKGFRTMTGAYGDRALIVGDDLFVTNTRKLKEGIDACAANAILIKPNQIGTVSETLRVIDLARKNGYAYIMSHRSGETEDTFIADLAVATAAPLIKSGAPCRSERVAKYNRLLAISEEMGQNVRYGL